MAFTRPTLEQLKERIRGDVKSELSITTILRRSFLGAFSRALAGAAHVLHSHLVFISRQIFPDQAEDEYMLRWGAIYGVVRKAATFTQLTIEGTGTDTTVIPLGTSYQIPSGETYTTDSAVTIASGVFSVNITAVDAGSQTNLANGEGVNISNPISGVDAEALVTATITEGEDLETIDAYRARVISQIQEPPAGGAPNDYIGWALEVAGVTRAFVFPGWMGLGTVGLTFFEDNDDPIIPEQSKVDEVQDYIDARRPVTAELFTFIPSVNVVDMTIRIKPNTAAVQAAVQAQLEDLFFREAKPAGSYLNVEETNTGVINLSQINEAISVADGEQDHLLITPTLNITPSNGVTAQLGTITWQTLA